MPVEFEIQKTLDLHGAKAIREFGVGNFNEECRKIVLRYTKEWRAFVERSGRWVDFEREYRTMDLDFMESIWWVLKELWDKDLLYEGVKNVPYSWAINTPLSNFEANLNYKTTQDPAITVRAKLLDDLPPRISLGDHSALPVYAYVWTTTPWTLPSNMAFAVGKDIDYSLVLTKEKDSLAILASNRLGEYFPECLTNGKEEQPETGAEIIAEFKGSDLLGLSYQPFFPYFEAERENKAFSIYAADFVTAEDGAGSFI